MAGKPKTTRRKRADSADFQQQIMQSALKGKAPPAYVNISEEQRPFWDAVIAARAEWTEVDLVHAAALARAMAAIEEESTKLATEGTVIETKTGNQMLNPRIRALTALTTLSVNYSVKIQVHAVATTGRAEENINKNKAKKQALDALENNAEELEDGLIARPKIR